MGKRLKKSIPSYLFILPWVCLFVIFSLIPFVSGFIYSFFDYNLVTMKFTGLENFKYIFNDKNFVRSITTTLMLALSVLIIQQVITLFLAQLVAKVTHGWKRISKVCLYVPAVISSLALVLVWRWIFHPGYGLSTTICRMLGVAPIDWFGDLGPAIITVISMTVYVTLASPIVLYSAAIESVPQTYYEAAELDGASQTRQFFSITLPMIKPTILYVMVTSTIGLMQIFEVPMTLTGGGPYYGTTTMQLMLYNTALGSGKFGRASAMGVVMFAIIAVLSIIQFRVNKSDIEY